MRLGLLMRRINRVILKFELSRNHQKGSKSLEIFPSEFSAKMNLSTLTLFAKRRLYVG